MTDPFKKPRVADGDPIPNAIPNVGAAERAAVIDAIDSGMLAVGPAIADLERTLAARLGDAYAVAVQNGTAALHLALLAAGVRPGDLVIVPEATFIATANAVRYCGADPLLVDVDPITGLIDTASLGAYLDADGDTTVAGTIHRPTGRRVAAIIPVHLYGQAADLNAVAAIAEPRAIAIVEDAAEALGATYHGTPVGAPRQFAILSFNGNKIITGGAGGLVLARDAIAADRCRYLANQARDDALYFDHGDVGFNYRLPNLNAAVIVAQLPRLDGFVTRKRAVAAAYANAFADLPGVAMTPTPPDTTPSCWMSVLRLDPTAYPDGAAPVIRALVDQGISARPTWIPLGDLAPYATAPRADGAAARSFAATTLCLPCSTAITDGEVAAVAAAVRDALIPA